MDDASPPFSFITFVTIETSDLIIQNHAIACVGSASVSPS